MVKPGQPGIARSYFSVRSVADSHRQVIQSALFTLLPAGERWVSGLLERDGCPGFLIPICCRLYCSTLPNKYRNPFFSANIEWRGRKAHLGFPDEHIFLNILMRVLQNSLLLSQIYALSQYSLILLRQNSPAIQTLQEGLCRTISSRCPEALLSNA